MIISSKPISSIFLTFFFFGGLTACTTTSSFDVSRSGVDSYTATFTAHGFTGSAGVQKVATEKADEYCAESGRRAQIEGIYSRPASWNATGTYGSITFQCVKL